MKRLLSAIILIVSATPLFAQEILTYPFDGPFEDAQFGLESAILDKGLVIDHVAHTGEMLKRTGADVGSTTEIFAAADIFLFCQASLSRKVMEADPLNVGYCPWGIFVAEREGKVFVGHRKYPDGPMKEVEAFLASIAKEAVAD